MDLIRDSGIHIPVNHPDFINIISNLVRNVGGWEGEIREIKFYEDFRNEILVPRYYPVSDNIVDRSSDGSDICIESKSIYLNNRQKKYIDEFTKRNSGIIRLEPGTGKTFISTQIVSFYKKKTIVITHKDKLLEQWKEEFLKHTTILESEIGRLSTSNYEECLEKSIILTTPHVIFRAVSNNNTAFLKRLFNANIGILFIDECHVGIGPEQFSKSSIYVNAKRTYGLSATPFRSDNMDDIIRMHLGEVVYFEPEEKELIKPRVFMFFLDFGVHKRNGYMYYNGKFNPARYYNQIYKSEKYNKFIESIIRKLYKKNRKILVLTKNVNNILELAKLLKDLKEDIGIFSPTVFEKYKKKVLLEVTDTLDMMESFYKKRIVFSTYSYCRDGNNRVDFDSLIMITPTSNPEQAVGRILRNMENKPTPIVFDMVDINGPMCYFKEMKKKISVFARQAYDRYRLYLSKDWIVETKNCPWK